MPNWFKLATGWLLTVLVALAFSWGAIAQVRNRVDMPGTVIPTRVVVNGLEVSQETPAPATTTVTVQAISAEPELETFSDTTTTTGDVVADEPDDGAAAQTTGAESSGTTSASTSETSGTTTTTRSEPSGSAASAVPESSGTTSTTSATEGDSTSTPTTAAPTTTEAPVTTTTEAPVTTTTEPPPDEDDDDPPPDDEPVTQTSFYDLTGGTVWITYSDGVVNFFQAVPIDGFSTNVEKSGPDEVKVTFDSDDHESEFTAKWEDGKLDIEIDENPKDDDDDGDSGD